MTWTFYAVELTTGRVMTELPLSAFSGQRHLSGGMMQASLVLAGLDRDRRRDLLAATREGKCTIVADRDGQVMGEWVIWRYEMDALTDAPVKLAGQEVVSYLQLRPVPALTYSQVDQGTMAADLAMAGFWDGSAPGAAGSVAIDIPVVTTGVKRDRVYTFADGPILQRLTELSQVLGGFDFWVDTVWDWSAGFRAVKRTFRVDSPRAGIDTTVVFDQAPPVWRDRSMRDRSGGAITALRMQGDGTRLGTEAIAICAGKGDGRVLGLASSNFLVSQGWPRLTRMHSWQTVSNQATADAHASALLTLAQDSQVPPQVTVLADSDPGLGRWGLGDVVRIKVDETTNLPDGFDGRVRILGWTMTPPVSGPETVDLEVTSIDADPTVEGDA